MREFWGSSLYLRCRVERMHEQIRHIVMLLGLSIVDSGHLID